MTEPLSLFRSTPVRLALVLVAVFSLANLLTLGGAYLKLRTDLLDTIETRVTEEIAGLDVSATPGALATLVRAGPRPPTRPRPSMPFSARTGAGRAMRSW